MSRTDANGVEHFPRSDARNQRPAVCEVCGIDLDVREGRVWWCNPARGVCSDPEHMTAGGPHVSCYEASFCRTRVTKQLKASRDRPKPPSDDAEAPPASIETPETSARSEPSEAPSRPKSSQLTSVSPSPSPSPSQPRETTNGAVDEVPKTAPSPSESPSPSKSLLAFVAPIRCTECNGVAEHFMHGNKTDAFECTSCKAIIDRRLCCGFTKVWREPWEVLDRCPGCKK